MVDGLWGLCAILSPQRLPDPAKRPPRFTAGIQPFAPGGSARTHGHCDTVAQEWCFSKRGQLGECPQGSRQLGGSPDDVGLRQPGVWTELCALHSPGLRRWGDRRLAFPIACLLCSGLSLFLLTRSRLQYDMSRQLKGLWASKTSLAALVIHPIVVRDEFPVLTVGLVGLPVSLFPTWKAGSLACRCVC